MESKKNFLRNVPKNLREGHEEEYSRKKKDLNYNNTHTFSEKTVQKKPNIGGIRRKKKKQGTSEKRGGNLTFSINDPIRGV